MAQFRHRDIGALLQPDALQRGQRGLAQLRLLARIAPEAERMAVMGLRREGYVIVAVKSGSSEVIWNERASPSRLRR